MPSARPPPPPPLSRMPAREVAALASTMRIAGRSKMSTEQKRGAIARARRARGGGNTSSVVSDIEEEDFNVQGQNTVKDLVQIVRDVYVKHTPLKQETLDIIEGRCATIMSGLFLNHYPFEEDAGRFASAAMLYVVIAKWVGPFKIPAYQTPEGKNAKGARKLVGALRAFIRVKSLADSFDKIVAFSWMWPNSQGAITEDMARLIDEAGAHHEFIMYLLVNRVDRGEGADRELLPGEV